MRLNPMEIITQDVSLQAEIGKILQFQYNMCFCKNISNFSGFLPSTFKQKSRFEINLHHMEVALHLVSILLFQKIQ